MQERLIGGGVAAAIFLPLLFIGGLPFQLLVGAMAMVAVSEMLRMKHLEIFSIEGILSMLAAFILAVPIDQYFISLPTNASVTGFAIISFLILAGTVLNSDHYSFDDAVYPITSAFYVLLKRWRHRENNSFIAHEKSSSLQEHPRVIQSLYLSRQK